MALNDSTTATARWRALPPGIWALGFGSLFMDMSSELVHSLLPALMVGTLGASMLTVGFVEGIAEATAAITKVFSGALSDYLGKRKALLVLGYALGACTKPVFALAESVGWVFGARFVDRVGKGIRGAPRDALVADITAPELRGAAYGLRQALDSVGALLGPVLAVVLMLALANDVRAVLQLAVIPAVVTVLVLALFVREPAREPAPGAVRKPLRLADARRLPARFWWVVALGAVFTLARFSEAFLILRAQEVGFSLAFTPLVMVVMNVVYSAGAYPAGAAADRMSARGLLLAGLAVLMLADVVLATVSAQLGVLAGAALWGLHMALTQGLFAKLVADSAPRELLGTGFGVFNLASGLALLLASVIAGGLWSAYGAPVTFFAGALFALLAALGVLGSGPPGGVIAQER